MQLEHGIFTVSLDFELYWGIRDKRSIGQYRENLLGVPNAVQEMLRVFGSYDIHATWATVGLLFFKDLAALKASLPRLQPRYTNANLSPYDYLKESAHLDAEYHFAPELIATVRGHSGQEIGSHTFSHYYCLEEGQSVEEFREDMVSAIQIAASVGLRLTSLIFPRNQCNPEYLSVLADLGVQCYRGNEPSWIYQTARDRGQGKIQRAMRLMDTYVNLSGSNTYALPAARPGVPSNFPSSRFLRPYSAKLASFEGLRLHRITKAMDYAAVNRKVFHLWWHPHNFGASTAQNIVFLERVARHYSVLKKRYGMQSLNMGEMFRLAESSDAR